jgi:hypothetical protein
MTIKHKWSGVLSILIIATLSVIVCYQTYLTTNYYIRQWRMPIWRLRFEPSFKRSAVFTLSPEGADFLHFLNASLPSGVKVVPPKNLGVFSEQSILQFFMLDKLIMVCPSGEARTECISKPDKYLIVTSGDRPAESEVNKSLIPFPYSNPLYPFQGIYVPRDYIAGNYSAVYPDTYNIPLTLLRDAGILLAWFLLGWLIVSLIIGNPTHQLSIITGFPVGMGIFTWVLFIVSLAGAPLTLASTIITYACLLIFFFLLAWRLAPRLQHLKGSLSRVFVIKRLPRVNPLGLGLCALFGFLLLALVYIGVGRGYSTFDDMAIWSLKGYFMAFKHDLFAANTASGHGLSYPLNLSLAISTFYLVDQDLLPGSKVVYVLLFLAMLGCIYWFFRENNLSRIVSGLGVLLIISTPVIFEYATFGFANIPFTSLLVIGSLVSIMGVIKNNTSLLYSGGLLLSLAGWTRPEGIGFALLLAFTISLFALRQPIKYRSIVLFFLITLSLCGIWIAVGYQYFSGDEIGSAVRALLNALSSGTFSWNSIWSTLHYSVDKFTTVKTWGLVVPVSILVLVGFSPQFMRRKVPLIYSVLAASLVTYLIPLGMFVTKYHQDPGGYPGFLSTAFDRAQFPAIILIIVAVVLLIGFSISAFSGDSNPPN